MIDPRISTTADWLRDRLMAGAVPLPGYRAGDPLAVTWLGMGENYAAWLVERSFPMIHEATVDPTDPQAANPATTPTTSAGFAAPATPTTVPVKPTSTTEVVVRIPYRPPEASPRPIEAEFAALGLVPAQIGTHGLAVGVNDDNPLGCRFVMTTYAPGAPKPVADWTMDDVAAVVDQLVNLHDHSQSQHGLVTDPQPGPLDIVEEFEAGWAWWQVHHRPITELPQVQRILPLARNFIATRAPDFAALHQFSLVHADLVATNITFHHGKAHFIDWEWAEYGDPARDLALLGGTVHGGPWYVPLTTTQIKSMLTRYITGVESASGLHLPYQNLLNRRDTWEVFERFQAGLHYLLKAEELPDSHYPAAATQVWTTLETRLTLR